MITITRTTTTMEDISILCSNLITCYLEFLRV
jgi:hypothetical protein